MLSYQEWLKINGYDFSSLGLDANAYGKYCAEEALKKAKPDPEPEQDKGEFHYRKLALKKGEKYYTIGYAGDIIPAIWRSRGRDKYRLKTGNVFRTKEDAEYHLRMIDLAHEVKQLSVEFTKAEWANDDLIKFALASKVNRISIYLSFNHKVARTHFATYEIAEQAMALFTSHVDFLYCLREGLV